MKIIKRGSSTVHGYAKNVKVLPKYCAILQAKRSGSKNLSRKEWVIAEQKAAKLISGFSKQSKFLIAAALYWGEGAKRDFSLSNTDPALIKVFVSCLKEFGITKDKLRITLRIYEDLNKSSAIKFWSKIMGVSTKQISNVNILKGKKKGKLKYGMCRIRIAKGGRYLKLIQSIIKLIAVNHNKPL